MKTMFSKLRRDSGGKKEGKQVLQQTQFVEEDSGSSKLETYSLWVLLATLFLLPIVFVPSLSVPFQFTKTALVFVGILLALILFIVSRLKEGTLVIPYNRALLALWILPIVYLLASVFSSSPRASLIGTSFGVDTFSYILLMALFVTLVVSLLRYKEQILYTYIVLFAALIILWLYQGSRLFLGSDFLSFDVLTLATSNILGKWNDLGIFFGLVTILTLVMLASLQLSKVYKRILYVILLISLFFLAVVNFNVVWFIVGLFSLGFFVHFVSSVNLFKWKKTTTEAKKKEEKRKTNKTRSLPPLIVLVVSIVFLVSSTSLGGAVSSYFGISQIEARPSWKTTLDIGARTYADNALFGSGPNTFVKQWTKFKPQEINTTIFWNADFVSGIGTIPTAFITTGVVGTIAWVVFLGFFLYGGFRALILIPIDNRFSYFFSLSSFLAGLYLWAMAFFYTPNVVLITLAFFFTGVFIASLRQYSAHYKEWTFSFAENPKIGFISVLGLTVLLLISIVGMYTTLQQYYAATQFQSGVVALNVRGDIEIAEERISRAAGINTNDRYHRLLADVTVGQLNVLQQQTNLSPEELRSQFQNMLAVAIQNGRRATEIDPTNYQNWLSLGRVYESVVPLGVDGAYTNARSAYERALDLNPNGAAIYLTLARLDASRGNNAGAREFITKALELKSDYTEAIFLLSQIEIAEGNIEGAIASVEEASFLAPNSPVIFFQLGLLRYNERDDRGAIEALRRAVDINEVYANARYFLGLAYDRSGETQSAIEQFERIEELNPDNQEVKFILNNLRAGRSAFSGREVTPPIERDTLPLEEGITTEVVDEIPSEEFPIGQ